MRRLVLALSVMFVASGCRETAAPPPWLERFGADTPIVVVGITGLRDTDLDPSVLPSLHERAARGIRWTDVRATGVGAAEVLAVLDGTNALERLRSPRDPRIAWDAVGRTIEFLGVGPAMRSRRAWVHAFDGTDEDLPLDAPLPEVELDPGTIGVVLAEPFRDGRAIGLRWIESDFVAWLDALRARDVHVLLLGVPDRIADPPVQLRVPMVWWGPTDAVRARVIDTPVRTVDLAASLLGRPTPPPGERWAIWPDAGRHRGGAVLESGPWLLVPGEDSFRLYDTSADPIDWSLDLASREPAVTDSLSRRLAAVLFGGRPHAWIAVRGSEVVDFLDFAVMGHQPLTGRMDAWALEEIDNVWTQHENAARYSLAAEPRSDGVFLDLGWPPSRFDLRLDGPMDEASWLGPPVLLGADAVPWALGALELEPWSYAFWLASAGAWPDAADAWWPTARVGMHVVIDGSDVAPIPAEWGDAQP